MDKYKATIIIVSIMAAAIIAVACLASGKDSYVVMTALSLIGVSLTAVGVHVAVTTSKDSTTDTARKSPSNSATEKTTK